MSAVTLETLRADYVAAFKAAKAVPHDVTGYCKNARHILEMMDRVDDMLDTYFHKATVQRAAKLRELSRMARRYGLEAAMLYKLSDGAIDPCKGGDA